MRVLVMVSSLVHPIEAIIRLRFGDQENALSLAAALFPGEQADRAFRRSAGEVQDRIPPLLFMGKTHIFRCIIGAAGPNRGYRGRPRR